MTGSQGPFGYPDYQRYGNYDGPQVSEGKKVILGGTTEIPPTNVSRFLATAFTISYPLLAGATGVSLLFVWWADEAGTIEITRRTFNINPETGGIALCIPNQGPYVAVFLTSGKATVNYHLYGSNRITPLIAVSSTPVALQVTGELAAKANTTKYPSSYMPGPAELRMGAEVAVMQYVFEYQTGAAEWTLGPQFELGASTVTLAKVILPAGGFRVKVINTGVAESEYILYGWQSPTASS
jgi:hypothetical protein